MKKLVFDACSLIAYFNSEKGADIVENLFTNKCDRYISVINVFEVCYDLAKSTNLETGLEIYQDIQDLPIQIIDSIDKEQIEYAVYFKNKYKISVADSFVLGLAKKLDATVVTSDHHEFDVIEKEKQLDFHWLR